MNVQKSKEKCTKKNHINSTALNCSSQKICLFFATTSLVCFLFDTARLLCSLTRKQFFTVCLLLIITNKMYHKNSYYTQSVLIHHLSLMSIIWKNFESLPVTIFPTWVLSLIPKSLILNFHCIVLFTIWVCRLFDITKEINFIENSSTVLGIRVFLAIVFDFWQISALNVQESIISQIRAIYNATYWHNDFNNFVHIEL